MNSRIVLFTIIVTALGLLVGLALHFLAVLLRDQGPSFDGISLRGNGIIYSYVRVPLIMRLFIYTPGFR